MSFLHSMVRDFILSIVLREFASLWSLTTCEVLGIVWSSRSAIHCCSYWIASASYSTWSVTQYSSFSSKPVIGHRAECSVHCVLHFEFLCEKLFSFLLHLYFLFFKLYLERNLLLLYNFVLFYEYALHLLQGLGGLLCFLLSATKASFNLII